MGRHGDTTASAGTARSFLRPQRTAARAGSAPAARVPFLQTRAGRLCALLALAKLVVLLPLLTRYGWHGDELYYFAAGQHLALGYVDFPPLVAVAGRLVDAVAGPSLFGVRLLGSLCGVAAAVAAGAIARELGATQRLQVLATAAWIATPFALGGATPFFSPTFLELATTALALLAATRLLVSGDARGWLPLGLWVGIGMEAKYTIAVPLAAFALGCLIWRRDLALRREAALGVLIAGVLLLPNVIWQATHGWISLDFASTQHDATAADSTPLVYAAQQLLFLGLGAALVVLGLVWLWRRPQLRPLALASAAPTVLFALEQGRSYYALPAMLPALVAGCLALAERRPRRPALVALGGLHLALLVIAVPLVVPILPERQLISTGTWKLSFWKDEIGWRELTAQTATAWNSRTPAQRADAALVAVNYGTAGALALYGPAAGLPAPVSGHLSYQFWHPARMPQRHALLVGFGRKSALARCSEMTVLGVVANRWHVDNDASGGLIVWCRLRAPLGQMWQRSFANASL
jgi:4-amino-4-deoxy-L-arabinose transferase-like glycosyltransferase